MTGFDRARDDIVTRFTEIAARHGDRVAIAGPDEAVTYETLQARAMDLADSLASHGVRDRDVVALIGEMSVQYVVALLAILFDRAAYLPLRPEEPAPRRAAILMDARPRVILEVGREGLKIRPSASAPVRLAEPGRAGERPAYVMYTSGSTGRPKGVVVPQRAVLRLVVGSDWVILDEQTVVLAAAPIAFDASTWEIWAPLLNGGRVQVPQYLNPSLSSLAYDIEHRGITHLWLPAGVFSLMVDHHLAALRQLRFLIAGGDVLSPRHVERAAHQLAVCQLANGYGPTENCTFSTVHLIQRGETFPTSVPIGRPVSGTTAQVLDEHLRPVADAAVGQLAVGGAGLALGYLNDPELTSERFVPDPTGTNRRVYLTGDRVRRLTTGVFEYFGRIDDQVKVRGFRVECGEVEAAMRRYPGVDQAVVLADAAPATQLLGFAVASASVDPARLRQHLAGALPGYMVPSTVTMLDALPLTPHGKIDRVRLRRPRGTDAGQRAALTSPATELQRRIVHAFQKVLDVRPLGIDDDFFRCGGTSLAALALGEELRLMLGVDVRPSQILQTPTPAELAAAVHDGLPQRVTLTVPIQPSGTRIPFFCVHGGGGEVLYVAAARRYLSPDRPFYALRPPSLETGVEPLRTVHEYATRYADAIEQAWPNGPCHLGGLCFGGTIAFECARVLTARGREVPALVLFDSTFPGAPWAVLWEVAQYVVPKYARYLAARWQRPRQRPALRGLIRGPIGPTEWSILFAVARYRPRSYPGRVAVVLGDDHGASGGDATRLRWRRATTNPDVWRIAGRRSGMFSGANGRILAERLEVYLSEVERRTG